jgi:dihydroorotase
MTEVMSKFLAMGMPMAEVVRRSTVEPAKQINHAELGTLTPGALADITVLEFVDRPARLSDSGPTGYRVMNAEGRLICQMAIKDGQIKWDYDGSSKDDWAETPSTDLSIP